MLHILQQIQHLHYKTMLKRRKDEEFVHCKKWAIQRSTSTIFNSISIKVFITFQVIDRQWTYLTRWKFKKHHAQQFSGKHWKKVAPEILWYWEFKTGLVIAGDMVPWIILYLLGRVWKVLGSSEKYMGYVDQSNLYSSCISEKQKRNT